LLEEQLIQEFNQLKKEEEVKSAVTKAGNAS
jgi:hypothetical protein